MIDLSHLTEEEQSAIMAVLRRDGELKKAEEQRIRRLERILASGSDSELKYRTGEWFYEAKSRRHRDKIHGSEIILASMRPRRTGLDGSFRSDRSRTPSSRGSDLVGPPKPARCPEALQAVDLISCAEKENLNATVRSPRTPRRNPFNRTSQIVVDPPANNDDVLDQETSEAEPVSPLRSHPETSQASGSVTSETSSAGFRPVPKKRTFLSRRTSGQSDSSGATPGGSGGTVGVPAPRPRLQRGSSEGSNHLKVPEEKSVTTNPPQVENSQQPLRDVPSTQTPSLTGETQQLAAPFTWSDAVADESIDRTEGSSFLEEPSLPQSIVDPGPPVSYDLNFIDKSVQKEQKKPDPKPFQFSPQTPSPTANDEDSIAKVLDWFSRSTDGLNWLGTEDGPKSSKSSVRSLEVSKLRSDDSFKRDAADTIGDGTIEYLERRRNHFQRRVSMAKESREPQDEATKDPRERLTSQEVQDTTEETQPDQILNLKSSLESRSTSPGDKGPKSVQVSAVTPDVTAVPGHHNGNGIYDASSAGYQEDSGPRRNHNDSTYNSDYLKSAASPQVVDRRGSDPEIVCVARLSPQPKTPNQSGPQPDSISQSGDLQDGLSKTNPVDPDPLKLYTSRLGPYAQMRQASKELEDRTKRKDDKDRINGPQSKTQSLPHQDSTAEKIKQLKTFWEQERNKTSFYAGKPKATGDGKVARGANQAKLNKRYTKSEFDLTSVGKDSGSEEEDGDRNHNFTVLPLNQRIDKLSPRLGTSRTQFNNLREFWSDTKGLSDRPKSPKSPKSPKRKDPTSVQVSPSESKCSDLEVYGTLEKTRRSPPLQGRPKSPGSRATNDPTAENKKSSKSTKSPSGSGKDIRYPKSRKDSFGNSSSRGSSLRRAMSMFMLCDGEEKEPKTDTSPRKQRQNGEKTASPKRTSENGEPTTPRARACVPKDFRHYLGMTDDTGVNASLAPDPKDEASEGKSGYELDLDGPVRASTPVNTEERRRNAKTGQRSLWASYSSSDAGPESSLSSASDTWSTARTSSNREQDDDGLNPVRKALRRAEARPKNLAKSMEDFTASLSPRQERRQDDAGDVRCLSDESSVPSSSSFSGRERMKKMSKSVPSFLQKEDVGGDTEDEDMDQTGIRITNKNLSGSSGLASSLSGSVMTMYSGDFGNVEVQGNIQFSINYVQRLREFHIFVVQCQDLAAVDPKRGRSDPYVKSYLVPDKANLGKRKTSVKKKTLNPTFNEILRYRVRMEYLRTQTLILSVWHHDTFGRNSFLGEVDLDLAKWDFGHTQMNYLALKARTPPTLAPSHGQGEMRLAVRFLPEIVHSEGLAKDGSATGELHIWVKECKNLPPIRPSIDPYVKCFVLPDTSRKSRQKTRVLRHTTEPAFNHTMVYDGIRQADLSEACVELTVWDRDRLASHLLGGLRLGVGAGTSYGAAVDWMDSTPYEAALWERMMATPNEWVEEQLPLRTFSCTKTSFK